MAKDTILTARKNYFSFLNNGQINDDLIKSILLLGQLDLIYRPGRISKNFGIIDNKDVEDLNNLISLIDPKLFKANKLSLLNPTFGKASKLVGGADADLIIDDMIIEIKTIKKFELKRVHFNQLIGYYTLYRISGIDGMPAKDKIKKLGIYFSRYGYLHTFKTEDIINENRFPEFMEWFKERAIHQYNTNYLNLN